MMNRQHLTYFFSVADHNSITDAARDLFISPQALVKQINQLEKETNIKLFDRTNRGVQLTEAGKMFYHEGKRLLNEWDKVLIKARDISSGKKDTITYATFGGGFMNLLKPILPVFSQRYPQVKQTGILVSSEQWLTKLQDVKEGRIDVLEHADVPMIHTMGLGTTLIKKADCVCITAPNHPFAGRKSIKLSDLKGQQIRIHGYDCVPHIAEDMSAEAPGADFREDVRGLMAAIDICAKGGIYLTSAAHYSIFEPLLTIPLEGAAQWTYVLVHQKEPSEATMNLLKIAKKYYSDASADH